MSLDDNLLITNNDGVELEESDKFKYEEVVKFECKPGYKLVGNDEAVCDETGVLSTEDGNMPTCKGNFKCSD